MSPTLPRLTPADPVPRRGTGPSRRTRSAGSGDLSVEKVLAGAGASATSALVGSLFGTEGTVYGAALGSVVSTVAAVLYQRSIDRARNRVRLMPAGRRTAEKPGHAAVPPVNGRAHGTPAASPRRRIAPLVFATVTAFVLGMLAVTGIEVLHGGTLSGGEPGTSISRNTDGGAHDHEGDRTDPPEQQSGSVHPGTPGGHDATPTTSPAATEDPAPTGTSPTAQAPSTTSAPDRWDQPDPEDHLPDTGPGRTGDSADATTGRGSGNDEVVVPAPTPDPDDGADR